MHSQRTSSTVVVYGVVVRLSNQTWPHHSIKQIRFSFFSSPLLISKTVAPSNHDIMIYLRYTELTSSIELWALFPCGKKLPLELTVLCKRRSRCTPHWRLYVFGKHVMLCHRKTVAYVAQVANWAYAYQSSCRFLEVRLVFGFNWLSVYPQVQPV